MSADDPRVMRQMIQVLQTKIEALDRDRANLESRLLMTEDLLSTYKSRVTRSLALIKHRVSADHEHTVLLLKNILRG